MKKILYWATSISVIVVLSCIAPAFAESAPVYDADAMQQQYDNNDPEQTQQDFSPQTQEGTFAPSTNESNVTQNPSPPVPMTVDQRMRNLEQQLSNLQNTDQGTRIESLQNEVQALRGQVEQLTFKLQQVQDLQKNMYSDLDKRLSQTSPSPNPKHTNVAAKSKTDGEIGTPLTQLAEADNKPSVKKAIANTETDVPPAPAIQPVDQPDDAEEQHIYQTAYNLIKTKKYSEAAKTLEDMLGKYPTGQFAANAHYWLGELYGLMGKDEKALHEFTKVVNDYPASPRVSDAQLKVGLIYIAQLKWRDAKAAFRKVISHFPSTASAKLAQEQLKQIKQSGH